MMIDGLREQFAVPGVVDIVAGNGGMPKVTLRHRGGAGVEAYLHGAHITSWTAAGGDELFFVSRQSHFAPDKPIRGGIPVIFPQFGSSGPLPQHGLARTRDWALVRTGVGEDGAVEATFRLTDAPDTLAAWPHRFVLELAMRLTESALTVTMRVRNTGPAAFTYNTALHTYFRVADISETAVYGLEGVTLIDDLRDRLRETETRPAIRFGEEVDRIYLDAPDTLMLKDEENDRTITIEKRGMPDVVVWNPWVAKAQRMPDFGDEEYQWMVCVETGDMSAPRELAAGALWEGVTTFSLD